MDLNNRYIRLALLTLGVAAIIYILLSLVFMSLGANFPVGLQLLVSLLGAALLVYRYFSQRVG